MNIFLANKALTKDLFKILSLLFINILYFMYIDEAQPYITVPLVSLIANILNVMIVIISLFILLSLNIKVLANIQEDNREKR
jgi:heme/copper-type cytochrome/quinol oxidase subunit 4